MYPWGDFHSLNLGWFLVQFKEWTEKIQEYLDNGGGTSENLANVIAPVFNAENSYLTGDYILYNDELYKALEPVPAGTWNPDAWERCLVTEEMGSGSGGVDNVARLMIAGQYSNTYNYQKYAICRYSDKLWMCNTSLPAGGEEWVPSHWDEITVGAGLTGLRRSVETLSNAITDLQNIVGNGSLSGFTATDLTGAANELKTSLNTETDSREDIDTAIENAIAYVENNFLSASRTYAVGEYFYSTEYNRLYRVTIATPQGTSFENNVSWMTAGGLNDVALHTSEEVTTGITGVNTTLLDGWLVRLQFYITTSITVPHNNLSDSLGILPEKVRPKGNQNYLLTYGKANGGPTVVGVRVASTGDVLLYNIGDTDITYPTVQGICYYPII